MKHIIIPTDFTLRSLETIRTGLQHFAGEAVSITLLHLLQPPADILDGLRLSYRRDFTSEVPRAFTLALESLQAVYSQQLISVKVGTWRGSTVAYMRNVLEHLRVDAVVFNSQVPFKEFAETSIDPRPLLRSAARKKILDVSELVTSAAAPAEQHQHMRRVKAQGAVTEAAM